jgi:hypothetical protein
MTPVNSREVGPNTSIPSDDEARQVADYLVQAGLAEWHALGGSMTMAADVAPPDLASNIRRLADLWSGNPGDVGSSEESPAVMMDVMNASWAECPTVEKWVDQVPASPPTTR